MHIPSVSAVTQSYPSSPTQQKSKSSPTTDAPTQAAAPTSQESAAASSVSNGEYDSCLDGLAALLSSQGSTIVSSGLELALHSPRVPSSGPGVTISASGVTSNASGVSVSASGAADPEPATASLLESQMMDSLGSNGVLTLADVESAEKGSTDPSAATSLDGNYDGDIAADFEKLSGGAPTMSAAQLTGAIQNYMDSQAEGKYKNGFERVLSQPA